MPVLLDPDLQSASVAATVRASPRPDYGIDAPGVRRGMIAAGIGGIALCGLGITVAVLASGAFATAATWLSVAFLFVGLYGLGMAAYMTYGSRIGKLHNRERLLDLAEAMSPWTGRENVLDVGCAEG